MRAVGKKYLQIRYGKGWIFACRKSTGETIIVPMIIV